MERVELIAPCHFGLESVLKREILDLGYEIIKVEDGRVTFQGDMKAVCRANIFLRTAERILLKAGEFQALELMPEEKETIELAKSTCDKVVVIINSSNAMELGALADDDGVDAILWIGGPGAKGFESMSDILCGSVNPSGKLVDTYVRDLSKDPTYKNIGDVDGFAYTNTDGLGPMAAKQYSASRKASNPMEYIEYEEGIYLGYKYYETAYDTALAGFTYGELNADGSTKTAGQVVYPFGYGLSYTNFKQEIVSFRGNEDKVTLSVKVTNTGSLAGKSAVEVYFTAPYTDVDKEYKIEKSTVVFATFGKTKELKAGDSETIELSFATDDLASYCYTKTTATALRVAICSTPTSTRSPSVRPLTKCSIKDRSTFRILSGLTIRIPETARKTLRAVSTTRAIPRAFPQKPNKTKTPYSWRLQTISKTATDI